MVGRVRSTFQDAMLWVGLGVSKVGIEAVVDGIIIQHVELNSPLCSRVQKERAARRQCREENL
jgi:hypothetical protein